MSAANIFRKLCTIEILQIFQIKKITVYINFKRHQKQNTYKETEAEMLEFHIANPNTF